MTQSRLEGKVGLFVFIGLALLAALLIQFSKGTALFHSTYDIFLRAPNVGGLKLRAAVLMSGVQVGTVSEIRLAPEGSSVAIRLRILSEYQIHKDARFVIEQSGFLGDQYVAIIPTLNQSELFKNRDVARADAPFNLQEVARSAAGFIDRLDETARKLNDAIVDVRRLLLNEHTLTNLSTAVANLRAFSERALDAVDGLNLVVATNSPALSTSSSNLVLFSQELRGFAGDLGGLLATNRPGIDATVKNIADSTELLKSLLADVQAGKGPAGKMLRDEEMAADLSNIADNLSITSSNLNRLGLWGILWQHKPPRTNAPPKTAGYAPKNPFD